MNHQKLKVFFILPLTIVLVSCKGLPINNLNTGIKSSLQNMETQRKGNSLSHYLSSMVYHRRGDNEQAIKELEETVKIDPEAITPLIRIVRLYLMTEKYEEALACIDRVIEKDKTIPSLYLIRGELCHRLGRIDEAVEAFQRAIEINPEDVLGYSALLELQEDTNDLVAAIDIYRRMIEKRPNSALLHYQLGLTYARIKNNALAIDELEKALQFDKRMIRAYYILALLYIDENRVSDAIKSLEMYLQKKSDDTKAQEVLIGAYVRAGEESKAVELAKKLIASPECMPVQKLIVSFLFIKTADCLRATSLLPVEEYPLISKLFQALALKQIQNDEYKNILDTLDIFGESVDTECNDVINSLWTNFGAGIISGWFETQVRELVNDSSSLSLRLILSRILMVADKNEDAITLLKELLPENDKNLWVNYYLAISYDKLKQFEDTEKCLKRCIELDPENAELLNFLGYLYADKNVNLTEAENLICRALKIDPENPYYLDSLGWVYYRQGNAEKAIEYIRKAIYKMETDDAVLRDHLGDAYLLSGDIKRAVSEWERALVLDPKNEGVKQKIEKYRPQIESPNDSPSSN